MSIIRSKEISLSELVEESNLIVRVKFSEVYKESVTVVDKSGDQSPTSIPPFVKQGCVFTVLSVLKNTARIELPEKIQVPNENWRRSLSQYKEKYVAGPSKSYTVPTYITDVTSIKKASIIFLHHFQGMFDLAARDAFENFGAEEKILMLIENSK